ncbi:kelch domain-containing protein 1-like isoform X1 [Dysidea avara]|uniref:kelch domain-containing protein 1-like isoform X1 n=1 Tax=Dysidea avara TaxID=196820 RepID=UPI00332629E7
MSAIVSRRNGGCGVVIGEQLYVWGGEVEAIQPGFEELLKLCPSLPHIIGPEQLPTISEGQDGKHYANMDVYDLKERTWRQQPTVVDTLDDMPQLGRGCNMVEIHGDLYAFSGHNAKMIKKESATKIRYGIFSSEVYHLKMTTYKWKKLEVVENEHIPPPLYLCGTLGYKGKLCVFGGMTREERLCPIGTEPRKRKHLQNGASCKPYGPIMINDKYWTNEYFEFDVLQKEWSSPPTRGKRPEPMGVMTFTRINSNQVVIYAGNYMKDRSDDLFIFNLDTKEFTDSLKPPNNVFPLEWPGKLTFHTATCLVNPDEVGNTIWSGGPRLTQKVLILWGKDDEEHITSDMWVLDIDGDDIENFKWKKLPTLEGVKPTAWHIAQPYYADGVQECIVVAFGGNAHVDKEIPGSARKGVNTLRMFEFGVPSLRQFCLMTVSINKTLYDLGKVSNVVLHQIDQFNYQNSLETVIPMMFGAAAV